jgi:antitoxin FitA-like protein
MHQLTVRGLDKELERRLREVAKAHGVSLNRAALILLREGAGLDTASGRVRVVGNSLDRLIGSWSEDEEREFLKALGALEEIETALWQ